MAAAGRLRRPIQASRRTLRPDPAPHATGATYFGMRHAIALAAALIAAAPLPAAAQQSVTSRHDNTSTSAVIIEGSSQPDRLRTHPDVAVPGSIPSPQTCRYGAGGGLGSLLFGSVGGSTGVLDEGCEARADSAHLANLAVTYATITGDRDAARTLLDSAVRRVGQTRDEWLASLRADDVRWPDYWRP